MNRLIQYQVTTLRFVLAGVLACFFISPIARAVVPPPDGGYPNGNTAEGQNALFSLTTGGFNTAVGWLALRSNTENGFNTAVGAGALFANISAANTATGTGALLSTTVGGNNTANGVFALFSNTTGQSNTATGAGALLSNTTGTVNTATGFHALFSSTTGAGNTAIGESALVGNTTGGGNTAIGTGALQNSTTGAGNTALGMAAGSQVTTAANAICIGIPGANVSNSCFIGHIRNVTTTNNDAIPILIDSAGQLGTTSSSRRFKEEIKPMDKASEALLALKPVTFHFKSDNTNRPEFGLIAEEVAEVNPDLVVRDADGEIYTVRYDAVNAMLLNEFLKEHSKVEQQQTTIRQLQTNAAKQEGTVSELKKEIELLTAQLKEQAAEIQKVSARIEMNERASQTVAEW